VVREEWVVLNCWKGTLNSRLEGLLDEIPVPLGKLLLYTQPILLNCWKGTLNSSWKVCWKRY
jgi:hypothetical protein